MFVKAGSSSKSSTQDNPVVVADQPPLPKETSVNNNSPPNIKEEEVSDSEPDNELKRKCEVIADATLPEKPTNGTEANLEPVQKKIKREEDEKEEM